MSLRSSLRPSDPGDTGVVLETGSRLVGGSPVADILGAMSVAFMDNYSSTASITVARSHAPPAPPWPGPQADRQHRHT